jgi:hypothetical protein
MRSTRRPLVARWSVHEGRSPGRRNLPGLRGVYTAGRYCISAPRACSALDAHRGGHGGAGLQELVLELGGELPQAARLGVLRDRFVVEVLGNALRLHTLRLRHAQCGADLSNVPGQLDEQRRVDAVDVVLGEVLLLNRATIYQGKRLGDVVDVRRGGDDAQQGALAVTDQIVLATRGGAAGERPGPRRSCVGSFLRR